MLARLCKIKDNDYYSVLLPDGTIKKADKHLIAMFLTSFKEVGVMDMFKNGTDGTWNDKASDMSHFFAETYAYIADNLDLVIKNFEPFKGLVQEKPSLDDYINIKEYAKMHGKSNEQIKVLCQNGKLPAFKINKRAWVIHKDTPSPEDRTLTPGGKYIGINRKSN
ncbi:hypothetical protein IMSAGC020_00050 [Lachnospiraceae bacterium]|nr:hypothetical protein IMSAGC020_00050 [Lachnospiraceae bacterium]